jgi:arsenate reductase-like glutaredoxin family protein
VKEGEDMEKETATQDVVDQAADQLLKEYGFDIEKVIANQVATRLGYPKANGSFCQKFANWKERRIAKGVAFVTRAPPELDKPLNETLKIASEQIERLVRGVVGKCMAKKEDEHRKEIARWSEHYEKLATERNELERKLGDAEERCRTIADERDQLVRKLEEAKTELSKEQAKLQVVQDQYDKLLTRLGGMRRATADEQPLPRHDVASETGRASPSDSQLPQKTGPGRRRKVRPEPSNEANAKSSPDDWLDGTLWAKGPGGSSDYKGD